MRVESRPLPVEGASNWERRRPACILCDCERIWSERCKSSSGMHTPACN